MLDLKRVVIHENDGDAESVNPQYTADWSEMTRRERINTENLYMRIASHVMSAIMSLNIHVRYGANHSGYSIANVTFVSVPVSVHILPANTLSFTKSTK